MVGLSFPVNYLAIHVRNRQHVKVLGRTKTVLPIFIFNYGLFNVFSNDNVIGMTPTLLMTMDVLVYAEHAMAMATVYSEDVDAETVRRSYGFPTAN